MQTSQLERPVLLVEDLSISFRRRNVLSQVTFHSEPGSLTILTGANGSGKTTLLNVLSGFATRARGEFWLQSVRIPRRVKPYSLFRLGVRRAFQIPRNWESLDVLQNLKLGMGTHAEDPARQLSWWLPEVDPTLSPTNLSLGQRRMLELLRIRLTIDRASLLLLDEPLSGLDNSHRSRVRALVDDFLRRDIPVLIAAHELEFWDDATQIVTLNAQAGGGEP